MTESSNYYLARKQELSAAFRGAAEGARQFWEPEFGAERAQAMAREAVSKFDELLTGFPDVGGELNWLSHLIPVAAWYVALYQSMKANGKTAEEVGKLVYDLNALQIKYSPKEKALEEGAKMFTPEAFDRMQEWAAWTQKRELPANWVAEFIPGDGKEFDFGYDYSECALFKYLKAQGVPEVAPYVCICDFQDSVAKGTGLRREKALAYGDGLCNFRYKKGGPVSQDWSTEIIAIRSRKSR